MASVADPAKCVICQSGGGDLVTYPDRECLDKLKDYANKRSLCGESKYVPFCDRIRPLSDEDYYRSAYHSSCYKDIVNSVRLKRAQARYSDAISTSKAVIPPKKGRPSSAKPSSTKKEQARPRRDSAEKVKRTCIFQCEDPEGGDIHQVMTEPMGRKLLFIKENTPDEKVRIALANVFEPLDCSARDMFYHRACLRDQERKSRRLEVKSDATDSARYIADIDIINALKGSLADGKIIRMSDLDRIYQEYLRENGVDVGKQSQKKHLKKLVTDNIDDVEFVQSHRRNESAQVVSKKLLGATVSDLMDSQKIGDEQEDVNCLSKAAAIIRQELLETDEWKFSGTLTDFQSPTKLMSFLKWVLVGAKSRVITDEQDDSVSKSAKLISQHIMTNLKTDRQARYKARADTHVSSKRETPLSIGLALSVHKRTRSKNLISLLSNLQIGYNYTQTIKLEKRIACGVSERMRESGGYCLPSFVKKNTPVFFAADNIDFLEDTADGQNTLHGTLLVINQKVNNKELPVNEPLEIPKVSTGTDVETTYLHAPEIKLEPLRFEKFEFNSQAELLKKYETHDLAWFVASHAQRDTGDSHEEASGSDYESGIADTNDDSDDISINTCDINNDSHKPKESKTDIMPTWAATNSLLIQCSSRHSHHSGPPFQVVNTGIVAPLLRRPPTDYRALYTALCLAQGISTEIVGPHRKTVITLDLDLYERGIKLQSASGNTNWFLRAGELHVCFASLHALGKYIEGSGLDSIATETGLYAPATLRQVLSGKAYKRGIEYHITLVLACYELMFETWKEDDKMEILIQKCKEFCKNLHDRDANSANLLDTICLMLEERMQQMDQTQGEMAIFLRSYMKQVGALLRLIRGSRQRNFPLYLAALEEQVKYYFAHDLYKYARLIPVHLAQTAELQRTDPVTWQALEQGDFVVAKSNTPFTSLFVDQTLEQKIRELKVAGGITGITQQEEALNRYFMIAPELTRLVKEFQESYGFMQSQSDDTKEHYQLTGTVAVRIFNNAAKLKESLLIHCQGNPFKEEVQLMNIVTNMAVADEVKPDILLRDEKGQARFKEFVSTRMLTATASKSIWDPIEKMKLKMFSANHKKVTCAVHEKLVKLKEDRQLLARFLVVQQSRPELGQNLGDAIGSYEFSVIPKSLFSSDGQLLIPTDKSSFVKLIESHKQDDTAESQMKNKEEEERDKVCIIDAMAVVQSIKKGPQMETCADFAEAFVQSISKMMSTYAEGRVIFDRYQEESLKAQTRAKRSAGSDPVKFKIHDATNIKLVQLKTLLSHVETKAQLTEYLGKALLNVYSKRDKSLVVVYGNSTFANKPDLFNQSISHHTHEEADTLIPLHVLDAADKNGKVRNIDVYSPDTDVLILLMDLLSNHPQKAAIHFVTGKGKNHRKIDIQDRCSAITLERSRGLVGLHAFSGADWGGKFAGVSKKRWLENYLSLESKSEIVAAFQRLGGDAFDIANDLVPLESFTCTVYAKSSKNRNLSDLRWELFKTKGLEDEKLPPTLASFEPHVRRANVIATIWKGYKKAQPKLPVLVGNGWEETADGTVGPVRCLKLPAPQAVVELVKCGCRGQCSSRCTCIKNNLSCTSLCKCNDCSNIRDFTASCVEDEDIGDELEL